MSKPSLPKTRPVWRWLLVTGTFAAILYVLAPDGMASEVGYAVVGAGCAAAVIVAARRRAARPCPWIWLAAGIAVSVVGDVLWISYEARGLDPFPSLADAFYLSTYPLLAVCLWLLARRHADRGGSLVDALIVAVSAGVIGWATLLAPYATDPTLTTLERGFTLAYPIGDLVLLPLVVRLVFAHAARVPSHLFLLAGMGLFLVADVTFGILALQDAYVGGGVLDALWLLAYVSFATAAWHPSADGSIAAATDHERHNLSRGRLAFLTVAAVIAPGLLLLDDQADRTTGRVAAAGSIVLFLLVLHRMAGLVRRIHRQAEALRHLSATDPLTGLANRRHLEADLGRALARADREGTPVSLAVLDLDHFKAYNDRYGHEAGDVLLRALADLWKGQLRAGDLLARYGGEEFVLLLPGAEPSEARAVLERMRAATIRGVTVSTGLARYVPGETAAELIRRADSALYRAKDDGRNRTVVASAAPVQAAR